MRRSSPLLVALVLLLAGTVGTAAAQAAPSRVVTLEWEYTEDVLSLGVTPVGAADLAGYDQWVPIDRPRGITDVGTRQQPSIERIAKLRPDLIIVPRWRATRSLSQLKRIAKVLVLDPYPANATARGAQYVQMVQSFRAIARALGRRAQAERVIDDMFDTYAPLRRRLEQAGRDGVSLALAQPAGTASSPQLRLFTDNSLVGGILERLGLRNSWDGRASRFGFTLAGLEALSRVEDGWFGFIYPSQYAGLVGRVQQLPFYRSLAMVKGGRVRNLTGDTWVFGGPRATKLLAERIAGALVARR